jgi:hypothetical protein
MNAAANHNSGTSDDFTIQWNSVGKEYEIKEKILNPTQESLHSEVRRDRNTCFCPLRVGCSRQPYLGYLASIFTEENRIFVESPVWLEDYFTSQSCEVNSYDECD